MEGPKAWEHTGEMHSVCESTMGGRVGSFGGNCRELGSTTAGQPPGTPRFPPLQQHARPAAYRPCRATAE